MEEEFGRIHKTDKVEIIIRRSEYEGTIGIDIREFIKGANYEGPSKKGIRIPSDKWQEFKKIVSAIE